MKGLFYRDASQFVAQIIETLTNVVFIFVVAWVFFKVMDTVMGMRVSPEVELEGLDVPEMGAHGYPEIQGPSTMARHLPSAGSAFAQPQVAPLGKMVPFRRVVRGGHGETKVAVAT